MQQLMRRIEEYKRLKDGRLQNKDKASVINHSQHIGEGNVAFKEPVYRIIDRIKNEPHFRWPNKMGEDPSRRN